MSAYFESGMMDAYIRGDPSGFHTRMKRALKQIFYGFYTLGKPDAVVVVGGKRGPAFSGKGDLLGPKKIKTPEEVTADSLADRIRVFKLMKEKERRARKCKVLRVVSHVKFKLFHGKNSNLGGAPRHLHAAVVENPEGLFFSRLVTGSPPSGEGQSVEGFIENRPNLVLCIRKAPRKKEDIADESLKAKRFIGRRYVLGGRKEWELRKAHVSGFQAGRFYFAWANKFNGIQTFAVHRGKGAAVEIIPAIEASHAAVVSSSSGRVLKKPELFDPSDEQSPGRRKAKTVLSIMGRQPNGDFRVSVVMTEQEVLAADGGEGLIDLFNKLGV